MRKLSSSRVPVERPVVHPAVRPLARPHSARLRDLLDSWERSLRARNVADTARRNYLNGVRYLLEYLEACDGPATVAAVDRADCEAYFASLFNRDRPLKAGSVLTYYTILKLFFDWCVDEEEIAVSPMARIKRPIVPDEDAAPPVLTPQQVRALLDACAGKGFYERRDAALLLLMLDTGMRHAEVTQLQMGDVDLSEPCVTLHRKGRRLETLPISPRTVALLDRYVRARASHRYASLSALWLGARGALGYAGVSQMIEKRTAQAGLPHIWPHVLRHTFASHWLEREDGKESDLMVLAGWRSPAMVRRYGRGMAQKRARDAHKRLAPGDQY